jgi:hypothetical protein
MQNVSSPVCIRICLLSTLLWLKALSHVLHEYGRSPVCIRRCFLRSDGCLNALSHISHKYGRRPLCTAVIFRWLQSLSEHFLHVWHECCSVCTRICLLRTLLWLKALSHMLHEYGRSPVCIRRCVLRSDGCLNALSHISHKYGRRPLWAAVIVRWLQSLIKHFLHIRWEKFLVWTRICLLRTLVWLKVLSHVLHVYGRSPVCTRTCFLRSDGCLNALSHVSHEYGRRPSCTAVIFTRLRSLQLSLHVWYGGHSLRYTCCCLSKPLRLQEEFLQVSNVYGHFLVHKTEWVFSSFSPLTTFLQTSHE